MYSYADRIRAVELYIKLGLHVRVTIRQLGYPTKNALKGWYQHYLKHQDLPASQAPRAPKYSLQQRQVAVGHYLDEAGGVDCGRWPRLTIIPIGDDRPACTDHRQQTTRCGRSRVTSQSLVRSGSFRSSVSAYRQPK